MTWTDKKLGVDRAISRRDFLNGAAAANAVPGTALADGHSASADTCPPMRTGMRGNHPGSYEPAHQLTWQGRNDWGPVAEPDDTVYDLIVVGAGLGGLAAAIFSASPGMPRFRRRIVGWQRCWHSRTEE